MLTLALLGTLLTWPAVALHELAHYLVARGAGSGVEMQVTTGRPVTIVEEWRNDVSGWRIIAAAYAPLITGLLAGGVAVTYGLLAGWPNPETVRDWAIVTLGLGWYTVYVLPSADDLQTAQEGFDRVSE